MSSYEISLFEELRRQENVLPSRLEEIKKITKTLLVYTQSKFPYYTPHGFTHSEEVEMCLNWLIPDDLKEKLNHIEIFLLILASWLHDWGMIGSEDDDPSVLRENHHIRTEMMINQYYEKIRISKEEAVILGKICRAHRTSEDIHSDYYDSMSIGQGMNVNVRYLSALVRIADEFDITANRVPEILYYELNPNSKAKEEFEKHMQVIGISYASDYQKYKVNISAIARDPKGAEVMENLKEKLQNTLNSVKNILASNGISIDIIELNLTTQGFIYKPIKFEMNQKKIVELLIGEHLYKSELSSIRELIQNSIDACRSKLLQNPSISCRIIIRKLEEDILEIEDNGMGMNFKTAKKFLSCLGDSIYNTEEFQKYLTGSSMVPISKWGIGILSTFLIADTIIVETKMEGEEPCKFTINSTKDMWKYEKSLLEESGTRILLKLKEKFWNLNIEKILRSYIGSISIPLFYKEFNEDLIEYRIKWDLNDVIEFDKNLSFPNEPLEELWNFENENYKIIIGKGISFFSNNFLIFNQGVFVNSYKIKYFSEIVICVDLKQDIIDLELSREEIVKNDKWLNFLSKMYYNFFTKVKELLDSEEKEYIDFIRLFILEKTNFTYIYQDDFEEILKREPFFLEFYKNVCYPVFTNNKIIWKTIIQIFEENEFQIYRPYNYDFFQELDLINEFLEQDIKYVINLWDIRIIIGAFQRDKKYLKFDPFVYFNSDKKLLKKFDFIDVILINMSMKGFLQDHLPHDITFAKFPEKLNSFIIYDRSYKLVEKKTEESFYLVDFTIKLFESMLTESRLSQFIEMIKKDHSFDLEDKPLINTPNTIINLNDSFINELYNRKEQIESDEELRKLITGYFRLLSFLPIFIRALRTDYLVFLLFDFVEIQIANKLKIKKPDIILKRMGILGTTVLNYWEKYLEFKS